MLTLSMLLSLNTDCVIFPDRQRVGVGVTGISCVSASWEATLPTPGGDACDIPPPQSLCASMVVYRCQEAPIGRLTREKDVFFLGADFDVPGPSFRLTAQFCAPYLDITTII